MIEVELFCEISISVETPLSLPQTQQEDQHSILEEEKTLMLIIQEKFLEVLNTATQLRKINLIDSLL